MTSLLVSAADASGDLHTAEFVEALRERLPDLRIFGVGGEAMARAGVELLVPQRELAVGGLVEVLSGIPRVVRAWRRLGRSLRSEKPDLAVLVDSPDFNLPLARRLRCAKVPVLYYISPQVWAWRRYRVRKLARRASRMAAIFPFEPSHYAGTGLRVDFVGHPLVERLKRFRDKHDRAEVRAALGIKPQTVVIALLPGSRHTELRRGLTLQLETARSLHARRPEAQFLLVLAPTIHREDVESQLERASRPPCLPLRVVEGRNYEAVLASDAALAKPGTVTVEIAQLGCPLVVTGRAHPLSVAIARRLVRLPSLTMPNLIAGGPVVPEFLQEDAVPERIAQALEELLEGPARELQLERLAEVSARLGGGGAARRTAEIAEEMLRVGSPAP
jgi:lipid-A-disaccharide synthase